MSVNKVHTQTDSITNLKKEIELFRINSANYKKDTTYIALLNKLSWQSRYSNTDTMLLLAKEAYRLSELINYESGKIKGLLNKSGYYLYTGKPEECIKYSLQILEKIPNCENDLNALEIYNQIGQAYFIQADYPNSYRSFSQSIEIAENTEHTEFLIRGNLNLGVMFSLLHNYEQAKNYLFKGLEYFQNYDDEGLKAKLTSNLGYTLAQMGELDEAESQLDYSISVFEKHKIPEWLSFGLTTRGFVALSKKKYEEGKRLYEKSLKIHENLNDKKGYTDALFGLAKANLGLHNYSVSENLAKQSLDLYSSIGIKPGREECYKLLSKLYKIDKKPELALEYMEKANTLSDSIAKEENNINITMLNARLQFQKEKEAIENKNVHKIAQQKRYIQFSLVALFASILLIVFIYLAHRRVKGLNAILAEKTKILSENKNELDQINKNQDKLFSIVGHDLRGPITSLKSLLHLSLEDKEGENYFRKFAPKLQNDLDHIQFTLDNLLNWGQTQMKGANITIGEVLVKKEIMDIIGLFDKNLSEKSIEVTNDLTEEMCVRSDVNHFSIIFRNLISNAIKFTPENGHIEIKAKNNNNTLKISVKDNGIGMDADTLDKIWNSPEHYSTYGTNNERGTGLGLLLCKEMVEKNNGTITVESSLGRGTTFHVTLPKRVL
ncbi:tetratricopeptide repeat-containing sensor histidine kinase [Maribacter sp. MMG018]|uniref:ATP-binding protein n=1 Tax=Maribacter sp. MMG018 TaxID=2822688 RepID=UPI001B367F54|nr:tetratricopeptide repeat-containing sensor histidine kinase [Maribacter sp. MMG018]MBQ4915238.1 tetratricopeptide repeat-containing sensor histidine kinase [Maribacter sp. MMG018]